MGRQADSANELSAVAPWVCVRGAQTESTESLVEPPPTHPSETRKFADVGRHTGPEDQCMRHARARLEKATVLRKIASWPPHPASSHVIMQRFTKRTVSLHRCLFDFRLAFHTDLQTDATQIHRETSMSAHVLNPHAGETHQQRASKRLS